VIGRATSSTLRALLGFALACVILLQGMFLAAEASGRIAQASAQSGGIAALCSGAVAPDGNDAEPSTHHLASQSSCCAWTLAGGLEPLVPPILPVAATAYHALTDEPVIYRSSSQPEPYRRAIRTQGSRAPPPILA
jgi:hypothetical protein